MIKNNNVEEMSLDNQDTKDICLEELKSSIDKLREAFKGIIEVFEYVIPRIRNITYFDRDRELGKLEKAKRLVND